MKGEDDQIEFVANVSRTERIGTRISCEMMKVELYAANEQEAREIIEEEMPGYAIDKIQEASRG